MSSVSFIDLLTDKLLPVSMKVKENAFTQGSALRLMSDNPTFYSHHTGEVMDILLENSVLSYDFDLHNSLPGTKTETPSLLLTSLGQNKFNFSPHVYNFVNDSIRFLTNQADMLLSTSNGLNIANVFCDLPFMDAMTVKQLPSPSDSENKMPDISPTTEPKLIMSVTVKKTEKKAKSDLAGDKFNVPNNVTLNLELTNRKTKELQKRSKKRRRRQKKRAETDSASAEVGETSDVVSEAEISYSSSKMSSRKNCSKNSKTDKGFAMSVEHMSSSLVSSFVISVGNASDCDSDWDSCNENDILTDIEEFEFTGLLVTNLNSPKVSFHPSFSLDVTCDFSTFCQDDEADEIAKSQQALLKVNRNWNEATKEVDSHPKLPSKVSFAPDDQLTEVLPVEICDRKGEWEIYAVERLRFKRRIDELEKIISPCLAMKHRLAVYKSIMKSTL